VSSTRADVLEANVETLTVAPSPVASPSSVSSPGVSSPIAHSGSYTWAIETRGLTKRFGDVNVVDQLDLRVPAGSVFGFLGPNGSGKTTTIRMLLGLISPTAGEVHLLGAPIPAASASVLPRVGALVEGPAFYPWLSGPQNLARFDSMGNGSTSVGRDDRIATALARVGLSAAGDKRVKAYSLGMRQRLGLASALLHPCELLLLDEPTNGMDPQGTREIRHLIRDLADNGTTVCLSSHLLAEIEQVCTHVAVMRLGKLLAQSSLHELRASAADRLRVTTDDAAVATEAMRAFGLAPIVADDGTVQADPNGHRPEDINRMLVQAGVGVKGFVVETPTLEDTFVALTGEGFDVAQ
jgi:ABC-2 type transport system ATP-binding protein